MLLYLGENRFDIATRVVVIAEVGHVDAVTADTVQRFAAEGADAILLGGDSAPDDTREIASSSSLPICVETVDAAVASACLQAGATAIVAPSLGDPMLLSEVVDAQASLVVSGPHLVERLQWARAAGIPPERLIVGADVTSGAEVAAMVKLCPRVLAQPRSVGGRGRADDHGAQVGAVMAGARLVVCRDTRPTRRTVDTVSELLRRRGVQRPEPVQPVGA